MRWLRPGLILFFIALFMPAHASGGPSASNLKRTATVEITGVEALTGESGTSVEIRLSGRPDYSIRSQISISAIHIEFKNAALSPKVPKRTEVSDGRVVDISASETGKGRARITVRTYPGMNYKVLSDGAGSVITIDVEPPPALYKSEPSSPKAPGYSIDLRGFIKHETAYRIAEPQDFTKIRNTFYLASTGTLSEHVSYKASARALYDAVFDLTDNYPQAVEDDQESEADLRETYLDISAGDWDLRLGKQNIVWGEAVGLFFADVVNAKDLREFVLPDFDFIRIPQWAADMEYTKEAFHLELVWIPVPEVNKIGVAGSEFPMAVPVPSGVTPVISGTAEPGSGLEGSELGARASYLVNGWDLSLFHLYTWDKFPAMNRAVFSPTVYLFSPDHKRLNISGLTFSKEVNDAVLKGEFVYFNGKHFSVTDAADDDGLLKKDYLDYLVGVDYTFFDKLDFNFQFMQRIIFGFDDRIFREKRVRSSVSVWFKTGFRENRIEPELLVITGIDELDMLLRPSVSFRVLGNLQAKLGLDIFEGPIDGIFGQYRDRDRVYAEARYDF